MKKIHLKNSAAISLSRKHDLITQDNPQTFGAFSYTVWLGSMAHGAVLLQQGDLLRGVSLSADALVLAWWSMEKL